MSEPKYLCFVETMQDCCRLEAHRRHTRIAREDVLYVALSLESSFWLSRRPLNSVFVWDVVDLDRAQCVALRHADALYQQFVARAPTRLRLYRVAAWFSYRFFFYHTLLSRWIVRLTTSRWSGTRLWLLPNEHRPMPLQVSSTDPSNSVLRAVAIAYAKRKRLPHTIIWGSHRFAWLGGLKVWLRMLSQFVHELTQPVQSQVLPLTLGEGHRVQPARSLQELHTAPTRQRGEGTPEPSLAHHISPTRQRGEAAVSPSLALRACVPTAQKGNSSCDAVLSNWGHDFDLTLSLADMIQSGWFSGYRLLHLVWSPQRCDLPTDLSPGHCAVRVRDGIERRRAYLWSFIVRVVGAEVARFVLARWMKPWCRHVPICEPGLRFQHVHLLLTKYAEAYFGEQLARRVIRTESPRLWVATDTDAPRIRSLLLTARSLGVRTASIGHGYNLMALPREKIIADYSIAWTDAIAQNIEKCGVAADRIKVVDSDLDRSDHGSVPPRSSEQSVCRIAVVTSSGYGLWSTTHDSRRIRATVDTLCRTAAERPGWQLILKSHPVSDYYGYFDQVIRRLNAVNVQHIRTRWSPDEFAQCSVAVFPGEVSGAILDCQLAGVPVIFVADCMSRALRRERSPDIAGCGIVVRDVQEAIRTIERLAADPGFREQVTAAGRRSCARYLPRPHAVLEGLARNLFEISSFTNAATQPERETSHNQIGNLSCLSMSGDSCWHWDVAELFTGGRRLATTMRAIAWCPRGLRSWMYGDIR